MKIYMVGGAVRDTYLKRPVADRDYVVIGATPEMMISEGYEQVGAAFPVFLHAVTREEYALARTEKKVGDGYHGFETSTDGVTLEEDLSRRDFTVNAMAIDMDTADLIDPFGGFKDLKARVLRHVGPAFREDPLRVVRMARLAAKLDFTVAPETWALAKEMVANRELNELSWERFGAEVRKVLETCTPEGCSAFFKTLHDLEVHKHVSFFFGFDLVKAAASAYVVNAKVTESMRGTLLAGMAFHGEPAEHIGGALGRDIADWLLTVATSDNTPDGVIKVLREAKAWNNGPVWTAGLTALQLVQSLGHVNGPFNWAFLMHAHAVTSPLASMGAELAASGLSGQVIGQRIAAERYKAVAELF